MIPRPGQIKRPGEKRITSMPIRFGLLSSRRSSVRPFLDGHDRNIVYFLFNFVTETRPPAQNACLCLPDRNRSSLDVSHILWKRKGGVILRCEAKGKWLRFGRTKTIAKRSYHHLRIAHLRFSVRVESLFAVFISRFARHSEWNNLWICLTLCTNKSKRYTMTHTLLFAYITLR